MNPSDAYLKHMDAAVADRKARATTATTPDSEAWPGQQRTWQDIAARVDDHSDLLAHIVRDVHAHPELAFEEHRSADVLARALEGEGFVVTRGAHGVGTALRAEWSSENYDAARHPTVAVLAEYDALPGIGHACGHNIIAAAGVGGFLGAVGTGEGRVLFLGTPAEEGHSGKQYMIDGGMLNGVDAAVMIHAFTYDLSAHTWVGRRTMTATFVGVPAHASMQPYMGRNALDAATLAYQGIGLLRQQMPPSDRVHAIIPGGGERASIIPGQASMSIYARSLFTDTLMDLSARIDDILRGAATMAGVELECQWDIHPMSLPVRNNQVLASRWAHTQAARGREVLPLGVLPDSQSASTDFGNVSYLVPGIHPMVKVAPEGVALHTEEFERWAATDEACRAGVDSATGLAQVVADILNDPDLLAAAREEFEAAGGAVAIHDLVEKVDQDDKVDKLAKG